MTSQDPNPQGGSLSEMAAQGTKIPDDAGTQNIIPSVPRPDQVTDSSSASNDLGATDLAGAADNAQDISRVRYVYFPFDLESHVWKGIAHLQSSLCHIADYP